MSYFNPDRIPKYRADIPNTAYTPHPLRREPKFEEGQVLGTMVTGPSHITNFGYHPEQATIKITQVGFKNYHVLCRWDNAEKELPFRVIEENFKKVDKEVETALCA